MLRLLGELHHLGLTVVLTTHDLNFVAAHLPRVVCLNGEVTADGAPVDVLTPEALERTYGAPMRVLHDRGRVVVVDDEQIHLHAGPDHLAGPVHHPVELFVEIDLDAEVARDAPTGRGDAGHPNAEVAPGADEPAHDREGER
jgi:energy-coupling factor transporter ATP-binding protein EcfA2